MNRIKRAILGFIIFMFVVWGGAYAIHLYANTWALVPILVTILFGLALGLAILGKALNTNYENN